jgi:glycerol uptake facilitator-like aquaporin
MSRPGSGRRHALVVAAANELALATTLLFLAVTVVRWLRDPGSPLFIEDLRAALAVIGPLTGATITALILSPPGRRSGGHLNPAVTVALWLMGEFPGRRVAPYVVAQLAGSVLGTGLARLAWGSSTAAPAVDYAAIRPDPGWGALAVLLGEVGGMAMVVVAFGLFLARQRRLVPYVIGLSVAVVIAVLGPLSGASINPARQLGPALMSGRTTDLSIYLFAPVLGAALGAAIHRRIQARLQPVHPARGSKNVRPGIGDGSGPGGAALAHLGDVGADADAHLDAGREQRVLLERGELAEQHHAGAEERQRQRAAGLRHEAAGHEVHGLEDVGDPDVLVAAALPDEVHGRHVGAGPVLEAHPEV